VPPLVCVRIRTRSPLVFWIEPLSKVQSYLDEFPSNLVEFDKIRDWSAKVNVPSWQSGSGRQEVKLLEANGLQPPKQKLFVPQNPNSLQQGAEDKEQDDVALHVVAFTIPAKASNARKYATVGLIIGG